MSNLQFRKILSITIHYDKYDPTRAGSYIDLPEWIKLKNACINIKNKDNTCFKYSVQSAVYDINNKPNSQEMFHYNKLNDDILNWEGVKFPTGNKDIERFEENKSKLVSINVDETDDILNDKNIIDYRTKTRDAKHQINLLKIENNNNNQYVVIKT